MKKLIAIIAILLLTINMPSYSQFGVNKVELEDKEVDIENKESGGMKKDDGGDTEKLKALAEENKKLRERIVALESRLNKVIVKKDTEKDKNVPYSGLLDDKDIYFIRYEEKGRITYSNKLDIYKSRVSKASLELIESGEGSVKVNLVDLNISMKELLGAGKEGIAYREFIRIFLNYNEDSTIKNIVVSRR